MELNINVDEMVEFLVGLLNTPSPTGYHHEAFEYIHQAFAALNMPGLTFSTTRKGGLVAHLKGRSSNAPRAVTAHFDTLGGMVKEIKQNGRLKLTNLGGFMWNAVEFEGVTIHTYGGQRYRGTILPTNPSTHVNTKIAQTERSAELMEVRIDAITSSREETRALGIEVGDFVFFDPRVEVTDTGFVRSRHLDDKAGVAAVYAALIALRNVGLRPAQDTDILIATYEEVGHGGAAGLDKNNLHELLVIDMGAMGEGQNTTEFAVSICAKDTGGPYHFDMTNKLRKLAEQFGISYKMDTYPIYASDGTAYWRGGGDARVALIGPGVDASHAYERTHKESLLHTAHLTARYLVEA